MTVNNLNVIVVRKAVPADIPGIVELGIEALNIDAYDELVISREKVESVARDCVSSANNFMWVAERDGVIQAAVGATVSPMLFHERNQAFVVILYSKLPGEGIKLIRELLRWFRSRPGIKMIEFTLERNADPRIGKVLIRLGLKLALPIYVGMR